MPSVGYATLDIIPSMRGFQSKLQSQMAGPMGSVGRTAGGQMATGMGAGVTSKARGALLGPLKAVGVIGGATMAAGFLKSSVDLERQFSKTMNVIAATTGAPQSEMRKLSDLAMKMGADTVFSANDASAAMLELARGGIKPAEIQAGALKGTLTLAAAGELEMGEAANVAVKAMGAFGLAGKDMDRIASALAGGANASSASVRDMSTALAQGGLAADAVGFSIEETTAVLAAFSNAGMEGSDAGTSMKTMLDRLIPASEKAEDVFERLGLQTEAGNNAFVKANGEFESAAVIAERLQTATEDLSDSERKRALSIMFGSDAQRAATILAKEGAEGLQPLIKATSDQAAAQEMADANMEGTAGSLERLGGAWETLKLKVGKGIAPAVQGSADALADFLGVLSGKGGGMDAGPFAGWVDAAGDNVRNLQEEAGRVWGGIERGASNVMDSVGRIMEEHGGMFDSLLSGFRNVSDGIIDVAGPALEWMAETGLTNLGGALEVTADSFKFLGNMALSSSQMVIGAMGSLVDHTTNAAGFVIDHFLRIAAAGADLNLPGFSDVAARLQDMRDSALNAGDAFQASTDRIVRGLGRQQEQWNWTEREANRYGNRLKVLPDEVRTIIDIPGIADTIGEVGRLQRRYDLTPTEVFTVMQATGTDWSKREVEKLQKVYDLTPKQVKTLLAVQDNATAPTNKAQDELADFGRMKAVAEADVNGSPAFSAIAAVRSALHNIPDEDVYVRVNRIGGVTSSAGGQSWDGGPRRGADGMTVPGQRAPYGDKVFTYLAPGEEVISNRYGQADRNRALLKAINANRMADGGSVGRPPAPVGASGPTILRVYDSDNVLIGTMQAVAESAIDDRADMAGMVGRSR